MLEPTAAERITVPFSGPGAGTAPLTWGQKGVLEYLEMTGLAADSCGAHFLPEGTTVETVIDRLHAFVRSLNR